MQVKPLITFLFGILLGSGSTLVATRGEEQQSAQTPAPAPEATPSNKGSGPDTGAGWKEVIPESSWHPHGFEEMDMTDIGMRDLCISFWYVDMQNLVGSLQLHTGHEFKRRVAKLHASPEDILLEQIAFLKEFEAETRRMEKAQRER